MYPQGDEAKMADFTASPSGRNVYANPPVQGEAGEFSNRLTTFTNVAGALVSLALVAGIGVWGYKLLMRDVSGIPVVRAAQGEMRVLPEEPGGELARHQGLSVNAVAAQGTAAKPADRLILAPTPIDLTDEDQVMPAAMVADAPQVAPAPEPPAAEKLLDRDEVTAALESGNVDELVAKLTEGVAPLAQIAEAAEVQDPIEAAVAEAVFAEITASEKEMAAMRDAPGLRQSMRPQKRPASLVQATPASFEVVPAATAEVDPSDVPAGTRLAQIGAYDSTEVAREQWGQISARFDTYMTGKSPVIEQATSGGRVFYRLRAMGFEDIADARRFCAALVAANAECIPVVSR
jgi:hypothetical protein